MLNQPTTMTAAIIKKSTHLVAKHLTLSLTLTTLSLVMMGSANAAIFTQSLPTDPNARLEVGLNASYNKPAYDADSTVTVLPQGFYDNNRLFLEGSEAGAYLHKDDKNQLRALVKYDGNGFDPKDGHNGLKQVDERKWSALAGASYMRITPLGGIKLTVATDVLGRSDGTMATLAHWSKFSKDRWTLYPELGLEWDNDKYNNYYYGVSAKESAKSGLPAYTAGSSVNPYVNVTASYAINERWSGFINQHVAYLSSEQHDSPLVDSRTELKTKVGFNYKF